jgi:hypothetical protein
MKFIGLFIPKNKNTWFCIPGVWSHSMDLLNYTQDGVLSFIHYVIEHHEKKPLRIYLASCGVNATPPPPLPRNREELLTEFCKDNKNVTIIFLKEEKIFSHKLIYYYSFYKSEYILSSNVMQRFPMKLKTQTQICINYYNPFKLDLIHNPTCNNIDYVIMSSNISCQIDSIASRIPYERYRAFGLPKEDAVIRPRYSKEEIIKKLNLDDKIKKIILYTPTHRDYEKQSTIKRDVFGYDGDYERLNMMLKKNEAILIVKIHGGTPLEIINTFLYGLSNIRQYKGGYDYTLNDILPYTDLLITDYTSTVFDFMLTRKPVIYNFFDTDLYRKTRGFSYDPVELVCAGPIVKNKQELETAIENQLNGTENEYRDKYEWVRRLTHAYDDGNACERVYSFMMQL